MFSDKSRRGNQNTHFVFSNFFPENCAVYENVEKYCRTGQATDDNTTRRMRIVCRTTKATDTHSNM